MTPAFLILLPFIAVAAAAGAGGGGDMPDFDNPKPCPNFRCSSGQSPVQKSRYKFVSTGCSKMGGGMMMMGMGGMKKEKYDACCDRWHACYQTCGAAKAACDAGFKTCSAEMCAGDEDCTKSADLNSMMLNLGGCGQYDQSQYAACECVKKDKVAERRAAALRLFYKKVAPESADKADALAKKADSASKFAALFRKLHAKYPASIRVEVDDQMARMQEMMRKSGEGKGKGDDGDTVVVEEGDGEGEDEGEVEDMDEL